MQSLAAINPIRRSSLILNNKQFVYEKKKNVVDEIILLTMLNFIKNFKLYDKHLYILDKKIFLIIKNVLVIIIVSKLDNIQKNREIIYIDYLILKNKVQFTNALYMTIEQKYNM